MALDQEPESEFPLTYITYDAACEAGVITDSFMVSMIISDGLRSRQLHPIPNLKIRSTEIKFSAKTYKDPNYTHISFYIIFLIKNQFSHFNIINPIKN